MDIKFNIGDAVWVSSWGKKEKYITCPHCFGKKYVTVILGDDSRVTIDCKCCETGLASAGKIKMWENDVEAHTVILTGYEINKEKDKLKIHYRSDCWGFDEAFATKDEALAYATGKLQEMEDEQQKQLEYKKENAQKSWAWNAQYHRDYILRLNKDIEYHTAKLNVAESKIKDGKK